MLQVALISLQVEQSLLFPSPCQWVLLTVSVIILTPELHSLAMWLGAFLPGSRIHILIPWVWSSLQLVCSRCDKHAALSQVAESVRVWTLLGACPGALWPDQVWDNDTEQHLASSGWLHPYERTKPMLARLIHTWWMCDRPPGFSLNPCYNSDMKCPSESHYKRLGFHASELRGGIRALTLSMNTKTEQIFKTNLEHVTSLIITIWRYCTLSHLE